MRTNEGFTLQSVASGRWFLLFIPMRLSRQRSSTHLPLVREAWVPWVLQNQASFGAVDYKPMTLFFHSNTSF